MTPQMKPLVLVAALSGIFLAQPVIADTIRIESFTGESGNATIMFNGTDYHTGAAASVSESTLTGGFKTYNLTTDPAMTNAFQSWCVDIFRYFSFPATVSGVMSSAASVFGATKAVDIGRLYTNQHSLVEGVGSTAINQSAFQLAVWEIVNEGAAPYDLSMGNFSSTAGSTGFGTAQTWLSQLNTTASVSAYDVNIWTNQSSVQDVVAFSPAVPEPQTYAMVLAGLGLLGFVSRRRRLQKKTRCNAS